MNLNQLRVFCTVVSEGGFLQASRTLYMSQSAISQHVAALEKTIGVRLFNRKGRNVSLTPEGRTLLVLAREVLEKADGIPERFREMRELKTGKLSVGFEPHPALTLLPPVLKRFRSEFPDIQVTLLTDRQGPLLQRLSSGEIEMAVVGANRRNLPSTGLLTRSLGMESLALIAPPDFPRQGTEPLPPETLDGEPLARYLSCCFLSSPVEDYLLQHQVKPKSDLWLDDPAVAARFVSEGICLAIVNRGILGGRAARFPVREIPLEGLETLSWEISAVYSSRLGLSYAGWAFEKILESEAQKILKTA